MFKIEKLTNFLLEEEKVELSLSSGVEKGKDITIENLSTVLDNQGNNDFSTAFKEIYNQYISDNYNEKNIGDEIFKKIQDTKILNQNKLEDTFDRLMKGEEIKSEENLDILGNLFNNTSFLKVFENFLDNNDKYPEILNKKNVKEFILNKIKLEKKRIIDNYLLNTGKVFIVDGRYYVYNNELIPATQSALDIIKKDKSLKYGEKKVYYFNDLEKINDKIILSTKGEDFIIIDNTNNKIVYKSKKGEEILENYTKSIKIGEDYSKRIVKKYCGISFLIDLESGNRYYDDYEDKYEIKGGKLNIFLPGKFKEKFGKLILPEFVDIEEFLDTPYFGDSVAIALGDKQYRRKTFSECSKIGDFIDIYIAGGNIFTDKSEVIEEKVSLFFADGDDKFKNGSNLIKITEIIKGKIDKMKKVKNIDLDGKPDFINIR